MTFLDAWNTAAGGSPAQNRITQLQGNADQLELLQKQRGLSALHGIDIGNPDSVQKGINALTGLGLADQAKGITDLAQQRMLNQANAPNIQATAAMYGRGLARDEGQQEQSSDQGQLSPDQLQHAQETMQMASDAVGRIKAAPQSQRLDAFNAERQKLVERGISPQVLDAVGNHLSDADFSDESLDALTNHYSAHAENFGNVAQGGEPGANLSQHPTDTYGPGTGLAAQYLTDPTLMDPRMRGYAAKYLGIDTGPGIDTAASLTSGQRTAAAAGPQAAATAAGAGSVGTPPEPGARLTFNAQGQPDAWILPNGTTQAITQTQQAQEAGKPREVPLPSGGRAVATPTFGPDGRATFRSGQVESGGGTGPAESPGIARAAGIGGEAAAATSAAVASQNAAAGFPQRMRDYDNLRSAAAQIPTGPHANFWGFLGALKQEYAPDLALNIGPNATNQANYEEVKKLAQRVLAYQTDVLGLPKTNQSVDITSGATPHEETSPAGIQRLAGMLEGNDAYMNARNTAFNEWQRRNNVGPESWNDFIPIWNKNMDPGVFQAHFMTPDEANTIRGRMGAPRFDAMKNAARRLGYFGGF